MRKNTELHIYINLERAIRGLYLWPPFLLPSQYKHGPVAEVVCCHVVSADGIPFFLSSNGVILTEVCGCLLDLMCVFVVCALRLHLC